MRRTKRIDTKKSDNRFAATGEPVWHFQGVRRGLWDYDKPYEDKPNPNGALIHAFDQKTGAPVAQFPIGAYPLGTPMTYRHQGRQHIIASTMNDQGKAELIALALGE